LVEDFYQLLTKDPNWLSVSILTEELFKTIILVDNTYDKKSLELLLCLGYVDDYDWGKTYLDSYKSL